MARLLSIFMCVDFMPAF